MRSYANLVVAEVLAHNKKVQRVSALHEKKNGGENYRITLTLQKFIQNYT